MDVAGDRQVILTYIEEGHPPCSDSCARQDVALRVDDLSRIAWLCVLNLYDVANRGVVIVVLCGEHSARVGALDFEVGVERGGHLEVEVAA